MDDKNMDYRRNPAMCFDTVINISPKNRSSLQTKSDSRDICLKNKFNTHGSSGVRVTADNRNDRFSKFFNDLDNDYYESGADERTRVRREQNLNRDNATKTGIINVKTFCDGKQMDQNSKKFDLTYDDRYLYGPSRDEGPSKNKSVKLFSQSENDLRRQIKTTPKRKSPPRAASPTKLIMNIESNISLPVSDCCEPQKSPCKQRKHCTKYIEMSDSDFSSDSQSSYSGYNSDSVSSRCEKRRRCKERKKRSKCKKSSKTRVHFHKFSSDEDCKTGRRSKRSLSSEALNRDNNLLELTIDIDQNREEVTDRKVIPFHANEKKSQDKKGLCQSLADDDLKKIIKMNLFDDVPLPTKKTTNILIKSRKSDEDNNPESSGKVTNKIDVSISSVTSQTDDEYSDKDHEVTKSVPIKKERSVLFHSGKDKMMSFKEKVSKDRKNERNSLIRERMLVPNKDNLQLFTRSADTITKDFIDQFDRETELEVVPTKPGGFKKRGKVTASSETMNTHEHFIVDTNITDEPHSSKTHYIEMKQRSLNLLDHSQTFVDISEDNLPDNSVKERSRSSSYFKPTPPYAFPVRTKSSDILITNRIVNSEEPVFKNNYENLFPIKSMEKMETITDNEYKGKEKKGVKKNIFRTNEMLLSTPHDSKISNSKKKKISFWCLPYGIKGKSSVKKGNITDCTQMSSVLNESLTVADSRKLNDEDPTICKGATSIATCGSLIKDENIQLLLTKPPKELNSLDDGSSFDHYNVSRLEMSLSFGGFPDKFQPDPSIRDLTSPTTAEALIRTPDRREHLSDLDNVDKERVHIFSPLIQTPSVQKSEMVTLSPPKKPIERLTNDQIPYIEQLGFREKELVAIDLPYQNNDIKHKKHVKNVLDRDNQNTSKVPKDIKVYERRPDEVIRYHEDYNVRDSRPLDPYAQFRKEQTAKQNQGRKNIPPKIEKFELPKEPYPLSAPMNEKTHESDQKNIIVRPTQALYPPKTDRDVYERRGASINSDAYHKPKIDNGPPRKNVPDRDLYSVKHDIQKPETNEANRRPENQPPFHEPKRNFDDQGYPEQYFKGKYRDPRGQPIKPHEDNEFKNIDLYSLQPKVPRVPREPMDTYNLYHLVKPIDKHHYERRPYYDDPCFTDYYYRTMCHDPRPRHIVSTKIQPGKETHDVDMYSLSDRRRMSKLSHKSYRLYPPDNPDDFNIHERRNIDNDPDHTDYYHRTRKHGDEYPIDFQPKEDLKSFDRYSYPKYSEKKVKEIQPDTYALYPRALPEKGYIYEKRTADQESDVTDYYNRKKIIDNDLTYKIHDNVKSGLDLRNIDRYCLPRKKEIKEDTDFHLYPKTKVFHGQFYEGRKAVIDTAYDYFHDQRKIDLEGATDIRNLDRYCLPHNKKQMDMSEEKPVEHTDVYKTLPQTTKLEETRKEPEVKKEVSPEIPKTTHQSAKKTESQKEQKKIKEGHKHKAKITEPNIVGESRIKRVDTSFPTKPLKERKKHGKESFTHDLYPPTTFTCEKVFEKRDDKNDYSNLQLGDDLPNLDTFSLPQKVKVKIQKKHRPHKQSDVDEAIGTSGVDEATQTFHPSKRMGSEERRSKRSSKGSYRPPTHAKHKPKKSYSSSCTESVSDHVTVKTKHKHRKRTKPRKCRKVISLSSEDESICDKPNVFPTQPQSHTMNLRNQIQIEYENPIIDESQDDKSEELPKPTEDEIAFDRVSNAVLDYLFIEFIDTLLSCYHVRWKPFVPKHLRNKACKDDIPITEILKTLANPSGDNYTNFCCNYCQCWIPHKKYEEHIIWCIETQKNDIIETATKQEELETKTKPRQVSSMPGTICFVCGRYFTRHSIQIHEAACIEKWTKWNEKLPKSQQKPLPEKPDMSGVQEIYQQEQSRGNKKFKLEDATNTKLYEASLKNQIDLDF